MGVLSLISPLVFCGLDSGCRPGSTLLSSFVICLSLVYVDFICAKKTVTRVGRLKVSNQAGVKTAGNAFRRNHMVLCCPCIELQQDHRKFIVKSINLKAKWGGEK